MAWVEKVNRKKGHTRRVGHRGPGRRRRYKTFTRKADADLFAATVETDLARGDWTDFQLGRTSQGSWGDLGQAPEMVGRPRKKEDSASGIH